MISVNSMKRPMIGGQPYDFEFKGLSTDTKPSTWGGNDVGVNSLFLELDTGDFYYLKQQGSSTTEDYSYGNTFNAIAMSGANYFVYEVATDLLFDMTTITVIFDGATYECTNYSEQDESGEYGATINYPNADFSEYPFYIASFIADNGDVMSITVADDNEHTIEIYGVNNVATEAVWEKIGEGGGDELLYEATLTDWEYNGDFEAYVVVQANSELFPSVISVEWDGDVYQFVGHEDAGVWSWGSQDAPFGLLFHNGDLVIISQTDDTHTIKVYG